MTNVVDLREPNDKESISLKDLPKWKIDFINTILDIDDSTDYVVLATTKDGNESVFFHSKDLAREDEKDLVREDEKIGVSRDLGNLFFRYIDQHSSVVQEPQEYEVVSNLDADIPTLIEPWKRQAAKTILNHPFSVPHKCFMLSEDNSHPLIFLNTTYHSDLGRLRTALDKLSGWFFSKAEHSVGESASSHVVDENVIKLNNDHRDYFITETQRVLNSEQKMTGYLMATWPEDGSCDISFMVNAKCLGVLYEYIRLKLNQQNESKSIS